MVYGFSLGRNKFPPQIMIMPIHCYKWLCERALVVRKMAALEAESALLSIVLMRPSLMILFVRPTLGLDYAATSPSPARDFGDRGT